MSCLCSVAGIPMELIIITIIGIVLFISICICVCILGQTIMSKRRQPHHMMHPHFNTDTLHPQGGCIIDEGQMATSWIVYPGDNPETTGTKEETRVLLSGIEQAPGATIKHSKMPTVHEMSSGNPKEDAMEDDYTAPMSLEQRQQNKAPPLPPPRHPGNETHPTDLSQDAGGYTAPTKGPPVQHPVTAPQEMPEYTLPVKKQRQESSPAQHKDDATTDDYLLPSTMRPDPIGENDPVPHIAENAPLKTELCAHERDDSVNADIC